MMRIMEALEAAGIMSTEVEEEAGEGGEGTATMIRRVAAVITHTPEPGSRVSYSSLYSTLFAYISKTT